MEGLQETVAAQLYGFVCLALGVLIGISIRRKGE